MRWRCSPRPCPKDISRPPGPRPDRPESGCCRRPACVRSTSTRMSRSAMGRKSPHRPQVRRRSRRRISRTSRKPRVVMTPIFGPAPFEQGVGADGGAVHDRVERAGAAERIEAVHEPLRFVAAPRRHLRGAEAAVRGVEQEQVGEGAADVDPDDDVGIAHAGVPARAFAVASASRVPSSRSTTL